MTQPAGRSRKRSPPICPASYSAPPLCSAGPDGSRILQKTPRAGWLTVGSGRTECPWYHLSSGNIPRSAAHGAKRRMRSPGNGGGPAQLNEDRPVRCAAQGGVPRAFREDSHQPSSLCAIQPRLLFPCHRHLADSIYRRCAAQSHKVTEAQAIASAAVSIRLSHRGPRVKPICPAYRLLPRRGPQAH